MQIEMYDFEERKMSNYIWSVCILMRDTKRGHVFEIISRGKYSDGG